MIRTNQTGFHRHSTWEDNQFPISIYAMYHTCRE